MPHLGFSVLLADITRVQVDAVVNAANETLLGGGGVDGAIHAAAGPQLLEACRALPEVSRGVRCPVGEARITPGFRLPARFVIHTVGPRWRGGEGKEAELLAACYRSCLELALANGVRSIAFPAISTGVFGYPLAAACDIAVAECAAFLERHSELESILLVAFTGRDEAVLQRALAARAAEPR